MNMSSLLASLPHLLRPWWLLALLALPALWWLWRRHTRSDTPWRRVVDAHLLPSVLQDAPASRHSGAWLFGLAYVIATFALAGPAWRQPVALYTPQAPLVVVMDLSSHMLVADLPPSRLLRARLKVEQLIALRKGGQIGLVAYAGDAFTVAPLSDDANSLLDLLAALTPDTMPVDGQHADRALRQAADLLKQAGFKHGTILLLTDDADAAADAAARDAHARGYAVDVIGVGTAAGAPLPAPDGTFAQDASGAMQIARLDAAALRTLAQAGGGRYAGLTGSSADDLDSLGVLDTAMAPTINGVAADSVGWRDGGPFLLLALLPLVALGFRRGWLAVALLAVFALPVQRVEAGETSAWDGLWQRADQRADHALRVGDAATANAFAQTPGQRAAAAYRGGDFATAARTWSTLDSANGNYNRGNALAQMKHYPEAVTAYQRALQLHPGMPDALANLKLVQQMQQQQQKQQQDQQQSQQKDHQGHGQGQQGQQHAGQQQDQQKQDQQQQQGSQQQQQKQQAQQQQAQQKDQQQQSQQQDNAQQKQQQQKPGQQGKQDQDQQQVDRQQQAPDEKKQAQADAAERQAIQQALQKKNPAADQRTPVALHESNAQREKREAVEALLQRVPDDPGGLLRRKFALEYARRQQEDQK